MPCAGGGVNAPGTGVTRDLHVRRMLLWPWLKRLRCSDIQRLSRINWDNVAPSHSIHVRPNRLSIQLGPGGCIGPAELSTNVPYPAIDSLSDTDSLLDEDFSGSHHWVEVNAAIVLQARNLTLGWKRVIPTLSYKMIMDAGFHLVTGWCEFAYMPFIYEVVRQMLSGTMPWSNLSAPVWLLGELHSWLRPVGNWKQYAVEYLPRKIRYTIPSFDNVTQWLAQSSDPHVQAKPAWISRGNWNGVLSVAWSPDVRAGRRPWGDDGTLSPPWSLRGDISESESDPFLSPRSVTGDTPRFIWCHPPHTTGGLSDNFDRNLREMLQLAKFELLTQSVGDATREQYVQCWRKWAQYSACMNMSPLVEHPEHWVG